MTDATLAEPSAHVVVVITLVGVELRRSPATRTVDRHRWVVERTVSWLAGCRRLHRRYERKAEHFLAFVGIAAALISYLRPKVTSTTSCMTFVLRSGERECH
jgi:hypothetical protein